MATWRSSFRLSSGKRGPKSFLLRWYNVYKVDSYLDGRVTVEHHMDEQMSDTTTETIFSKA